MSLTIVRISKGRYVVRFEPTLFYPVDTLEEALDIIELRKEFSRDL